MILNQEQFLTMHDADHSKEYFKPLKKKNASSKQISRLIALENVVPEICYGDSGAIANRKPKYHQGAGTVVITKLGTQCSRQW